MHRKSSLSSSGQSSLKYTPSGKGVIGAIGKPPGFKVVHQVADGDRTDETDSHGSGRVATCGTVFR